MGFYRASFFRSKPTLIRPRDNRLPIPECLCSRHGTGASPVVETRGFYRASLGGLKFIPRNEFWSRFAPFGRTTLPRPGSNLPRGKLRISPDAGGDEGIRTPDLLRARQALSQLSYAPLWESGIIFLLPEGRTLKIKRYRAGRTRCHATNSASSLG